MTIGLLFIIGLCSLQTTAIIFYVAFYRQWVTTMYGMMIAWQQEWLWDF